MKTLIQKRSRKGNVLHTHISTGKASFMCQLIQVIVSSYLAKHRSDVAVEVFFNEITIFVCLRRVFLAVMSGTPL